MPFAKQSLSRFVKQSAVLKWRGVCVSLAAVVSLAGCAAQNGVQRQPEGLNAPRKAVGRQQQRFYKNGRPYYSAAAYSGRLTERSCLERAMFFESNRSGREGLVAVGTVVMNRVHSSHYPNTICAVVGQKNQFAPGVLTRPMNIAIMPDIAAAADAVLRGERSPKLKNTMYFHTAGMRFPYNNMHYVLVAGGNSFYERRRRDGSLTAPVNDETYDVAYAFAQDRGEAAPASAALDGAAAGNVDNIHVASIGLDARARLLQTAYQPVNDAAGGAAAANASLASIYDRNGADSRPQAEQSRANEAAADLAAYPPENVPVPVLKASFAEEPADNAETGQMDGGQAKAKPGAPHFMPISAPIQADNSGAIREVGGNGGNNAGGAAARHVLTFSYKMPGGR